MNKKLSQHLVLDRCDRVVYILTTIAVNGFGEIVKAVRDIDEKGRPRWQCITDIGLLLVMDEKQEFIITMYVATQPKVSAMYKGNTPTWLLKVVKKNKTHAIMQNQVKY